jgi:hypothetical protein
MAAVNPKIVSPGSRVAGFRRTSADFTVRTKPRAALVRPLSSIASRVRDVFAVAVDAAMGRYDR